MDPKSRPDSTSDWNKQAYNPESDLEAVPKPYHGTQSYTLVPAEEKIVTNTEHGGRRGTICGLRRKWFYILLAVIVVVVIGAAVGGGVGATVGKSSDSDSDSSSSNSTSPSQNSTTPITGLNSNSSLASAAYNDSSNTLQYRVYYQDENDMIKESAWNDTEQTWYVSNDATGKAKKGSPLAAAATGPPDYTFVRPIPYLGTRLSIESTTNILLSTPATKRVLPRHSEHDPGTLDDRRPKLVHWQHERRVRPNPWQNRSRIFLAKTDRLLRLREHPPPRLAGPIIQSPTRK